MGGIGLGEVGSGKGESNGDEDEGGAFLERRR